MKWCTIRKEYVEYLKRFDKRIPNVEYGEYKFKPFFSPLFEKDGLIYVTQVSSPKDRYLNLKEQIDFIKIFNNKNLIAVINLNYMFPVPKDEIIYISYKDIGKYRKFTSEESKESYILLLKTELKAIKEKKVDLKAHNLYLQLPNNNFLQNRCLDFLMLEEKGNEYIKLKNNLLKENVKYKIPKKSKNKEKGDER